MDMTREERVRTKAQLEAARALIQDPEHWTTGDIAVDEIGYPRDPWDPRCRRWCALGALEKAANQTPPELTVDVFSHSCCSIINELDDPPPMRSNYEVITYLNDDVARHDLVMQAFDRAIEEVA